MTTAADLFVTLPLNPNGTPTSTRTGSWGQFRVTGPYEYAVRSRHGVVFHGAWDRADATRYAWSLGQGAVDTERGPRVIKVAPYYYCAAWGRVPTAAVHPLDPCCYVSWDIKPAGSDVLGCDPDPERAAVDADRAA